MKVAFLIWSFWPSPEGGAERQCRLVACALAKHGIGCTVFTAWSDRSRPVEETIAGIRVRRIGRGIEAALKASTRVSSSLRRLLTSNPTVHTHIWPALSFWSHLPWQWRARRSYITELIRTAERGTIDAEIVHAFETSWLAGVADMLAERIGAVALCRSASWPALAPLPYDVPMRRDLQLRRMKPCYTAMTAAMVEDLVEKGIERRRCFLVPNGVLMPQKAAEPERHHKVLYIGNYSQGSHWKAFDVLIKAWRRVVAVKPQARLVMVGGGDATPWKRLARTLGCDGSIEWCGPTADPGPHYVNAAIFVLPSRIEGMSNALLEAQSHGLPCVVSGIPGNTAVVAHGVNGWVVPVGDDQALAAAILALLNDSACRRRLGTAARTRAERNFSLDAVVGQLAGTYRLLRDRERS